MVFLAKKEPGRKFFEEIKPLCGRAYLKPTKTTGYEGRVIIHQPQRAALKFLRKFESEHGKPFKVQEVHIALDFLSENFEDAQELQHFLEQHFVKSHHKGISTNYNSTYYFSPRKWGRTNAVVYSDRQNRFTGTPCAHLEFRFSGSSLVAGSLGIKRLSDLCRFDFLKFWAKKFVLKEIDYPQLGRQSHRRGRAKQTDKAGVDRCFAGILKRNVWYANGEPAVITAQMIQDFFRGYGWFKSETALRRLDASNFLKNMAVV